MRWYNRLAHRVWGAAVEPRAVTLITVAAYGLATGLGYSLLLSPPGGGHEENVWLRAISAIFLAGGGAVGVPTAFRGEWWLERSAAGFTAAGTIGALLEALAVHEAHGLQTPWITVLALALGVLFWAARYARVRLLPYAPGRGPLLPEHEARLHPAPPDLPTIVQ